MFILFNFCQEQGRCNDLLSKCDGPIPQHFEDRHLINSPKMMRSIVSTPGFSTNIISDRVHCDPLSCMASGSRCHTADYLKETKDVDDSVPCLMYSLSKPPSHAFSKSSANSSLRMRSIVSTPSSSTNIISDRVHCDPLSCVASGSRCHTADYTSDQRSESLSLNLE